MFSINIPNRPNCIKMAILCGLRQNLPSGLNLTEVKKNFMFDK